MCYPRLFDHYGLMRGSTINNELHPATSNYIDLVCHTMDDADIT